MKKKVLFILHFPPPVHGAAMVGKYIMDSETINKNFRSRYLNLGTSRSIDEIGKGGFIKWLRYVALLVKTLFYVLSFRPNLVYLTLTSSGGGFYKDALVAILAKLAGARMVYHFHNKGVRIRQDKWLDNMLYKIVFQNAKVILLSEHLYPDVEKYVSKTSVYICANGIPEIKGNFLLESREKIKEPVEILFLSNLIESKGVFVLLKACKNLKEKGVSFNCIYVGGEGDISPNKLQKKIREFELDNYVTYAGKKYGTEKIEVFSSADIFVHPSLSDCFPLVLIEAMQFSIPIVSTYEGGIPGIVEDKKTGFLVELNDATALAEKLEVLIKTSVQRERMGEAGRKKYEKEFTLEAFESRFTTILKDISS